MKISLTIAFLLLSTTVFANDKKPVEEQLPEVCYNGTEPHCILVE